MDEVLGGRSESVRLVIVAQLHPSRTAIRRFESMVCCLRPEVPDHADQILERTKSYCQLALTQAR